MMFMEDFTTEERIRAILGLACLVVAGMLIAAVWTGCRASTAPDDGQHLERPDSTGGGLCEPAGCP